LGPGTIWPAYDIGPIAPRPIDAQFALLSLISQKVLSVPIFRKVLDEENLFLLGLGLVTVNLDKTVLGSFTIYSARHDMLYITLLPHS
jgi:hypothetical protein